MHELPIGTVPSIDVCYPDDHFFAWSTRDARWSPLEAHGVRKISALCDHCVLDVRAPAGESTSDPLERVSHCLRAVLHRTPRTEQRRVWGVGPTINVGLRIAGAHRCERLINA